MSSVASVDPKRLSLLNPEEAVDLFRELLWAESWRQGIDILDVSVPSNITANDGGVDAEIGSAPKANGLIAKGLSRYQIKTGEFSGTTDSQVKELLFKPQTTNLKERVEFCLNNRGTFFVVFFGNDAPNQTEDDTTKDKCLKMAREVSQRHSWS